MSRMIDDGIWHLQPVHKRLDEAHKAACAALARFDAAKADHSLSTEDRTAARALLQETAELCQALRCALNAVPEIATPKAVRLANGNHRLDVDVKLPCTRTAKSLLDEFKKKKSGVVATSINYGNPICA